MLRLPESENKDQWVEVTKNLKIKKTFPTKAVQQWNRLFLRVTEIP